VPTVSVTLLANISGFISPLKAATQAAKDLRTELSRAASAGNLDAVASSALKAGLALSGGFLLATTAAARFEKQMSEVSAVSGATAGELHSLSEAAIEAGKATIFSAAEAAKAEAELAKAGLSTADILGGALSGALSLASAGSLDLAEAADTAAKAMNVFDLKGSDVSHIADVLAAAANKSAVDVHELGQALRAGGLAAKNAGLSLEDTVGVLAAFGDNALIGQDAGTSFKTMLQALAAPSAEAVTRMKQLGIETYDASGTFVGVTKLAGVLANKLGTLTQEQRNEALATIFGSDAMRAAAVLYNEGESGIRDYIAAVDDQGAAAEVSRKKLDNLAGDVEQLTGSLETLFITSGSGASGGLRALTQTATNLVNTIATLPGPVQTAGVVLVGLSGAGLLAFSAFIKVQSSVARMSEELEKAGPIAARTGKVLNTAVGVVGRLSAAFAVWGIAMAAVNLALKEDLNPQLDAAIAGLKEWDGKARLSGEAARLFGEDVKDLDDALGYAAATGVAKFINKFDEIATLGALDTGADRIKAFDSALAQLARSGNGDAALRIIQERAKAAGISVQDLIKLLPEYAGATEVAAGATKGLAGAAVKARTDLKELDDQLHDNVTAAFSLEEAQDKVAQSVADLTEQIKKQKEAGDEGAGSLTGQTDAARANRRAVRGLVSDYQDLVTEYGVAGKSTDGLRQQLEDQLVTMGITREEAHKYAAQLGLIPAEVTTKVKLEAAEALTAAAETHRELARILNTQITVTPRVYGPFIPDSLKRWGGITEHAAIGTLREAATYSTRSPARYAFAEPATGGEAFVPKHGNYARSMAILSQAAGWYGATVSPQGGWGGGSTAETVTVNVLLDGQAIEPRMVKVVTERDRATKRRVQAG